jgi:hypothetical protein
MSPYIQMGEIVRAFAEFLKQFDDHSAVMARDGLVAAVAADLARRKLVDEGILDLPKTQYTVCPRRIHTITADW